MRARPAGVMLTASSEESAVKSAVFPTESVAATAESAVLPTEADGIGGAVEVPKGETPVPRWLPTGETPLPRWLPTGETPERGMAVPAMWLADTDRIVCATITGGTSVPRWASTSHPKKRVA